MGAKYCKNVRCSEAKNGKPCAVADECPMFLWDITREKWYKTQKSNRLKKRAKNEREF